MILDLCGNFLSKSDLIILNDVKFLKRICLGDNGVGMPANLNVKAPYLANITLSALFQMHALLDNATVEELSQFLSLKDLTLSKFVSLFLDITEAYEKKSKYRKAGIERNRLLSLHRQYFANFHRPSMK